MREAHACGNPPPPPCEGERAGLRGQGRHTHVSAAPTHCTSRAALALARPALLVRCGAVRYPVCACACSPHPGYCEQGSALRCMGGSRVCPQTTRHHLRGLPHALWAACARIRRSQAIGLGGSLRALLEVRDRVCLASAIMSGGALRARLAAYACARSAPSPRRPLTRICSRRGPRHPKRESAPQRVPAMLYTHVHCASAVVRGQRHELCWRHVPMPGLCCRRAKRTAGAPAIGRPGIGPYPPVCRPLPASLPAPTRQSAGPYPPVCRPLPASGYRPLPASLPQQLFAVTVLSAGIASACLS